MFNESHRVQFMNLLEYLAGMPVWLAILFSVMVNIIISVVGFMPSTFVTAANIIYFGFAGGLVLSIVGEAAGAMVSFFLYRKSFEKLSSKLPGKKPNKWIGKLMATSGKEAFILVILLRIFPFAPSGLVTLAASISRMGAAAFMVSSTVGKIPALFIEAYSVHTVMGWKAEYQLTAVAFAVVAGIWYYYWTTKRKNGGNEDEIK